MATVAAAEVDDLLRLPVTAWIDEESWPRRIRRDDSGFRHTLELFDFGGGRGIAVPRRVVEPVRRLEPPGGA